jgi:hypothetical protein
MFSQWSPDGGVPSILHALQHHHEGDAGDDSGSERDV